MQRRFCSAALAAVATVVLCIAALAVQAYEGQLHQKLTFLAAKQFNRCVAGTDIPMLTPLQVRYIAKTNVAQADRNAFVRMFNWRYYDRGNEAERSKLWAIDTRFHEHFNEVLKRLDGSGDSAQLYSDLGRVVGYVQLVSSPAHAVPVYTARFWRFSFTDRFDAYSVDEAAIQGEIGATCDFLDQPATDYGSILRSVATDTLTAVRSPISGLPASWEVFWEPDENPDNFGEYGAAGNNFGRKTEFNCEADARCVLLKDDPLYAEFARERHVSAVRGTIGAMLLMQRALGGTEGVTEAVTELVDAD
jgi:hypothetical protein